MAAAMAVVPAERVNLGAAERAERAGESRAGALLKFQRLVAKVVAAKGRRLAPEAQLDEAHSATGATFLRQARADLLRTNRNMFEVGGTGVWGLRGRGARGGELHRVEAPRGANALGSGGEEDEQAAYVQGCGTHSGVG